MASDPHEMVTLKIPRPLYARLRQLIEGTGFRSVTEFATYVLRDLAAHPHSPQPESAQMSEAELEEARRRLRELGYL